MFLIRELDLCLICNNIYIKKLTISEDTYNINLDVGGLRNSSPVHRHDCFVWFNTSVSLMPGSTNVD